MTHDDELSRLFAAERAEQPSPAATEGTWQSLQSALAVSTPPLPVAHGPLKLGLSLAGKSFLAPALVAFTATTAGLSVHAALVSPTATQASPSSDVTTDVAAAPLPVGDRRLGEPPPVTTRPAPARASTARSASGFGSAGSTFSEELRLIKAAKREMDAGQLHLAQVWLDEHERSFPRGIFRAERESLRARIASAPAAREAAEKVPPSK